MTEAVSMERDWFKRPILTKALQKCADAVGGELEPRCAAELKEVRRGLLEDYRISPLLVDRCKDDVKVHCSGVPRREVLHCLMDVARHQYRTAADADTDAAKLKRLSDGCYTSVCSSRT